MSDDASSFGTGNSSLQQEDSDALLIVTQTMLRAQCKRCKTLKVRCEFNDGGDSCKRCTNGGHECRAPIEKRHQPNPTREHLLDQIRRQESRIQALQQELGLREGLRGGQEPSSSSALLPHTEPIVEGGDMVDNTAPKAVNTTVVKKLRGACIGCKKLKVRCDYDTNADDCRRCLDGGRVCVLPTRKRGGPPRSARHKLLDRIREQAEHIKQLTQQLEERPDTTFDGTIPSSESPVGTFDNVTTIFL